MLNIKSELHELVETLPDSESTGSETLFRVFNQPKRVRILFAGGFSRN